MSTTKIPKRDIDRRHDEISAQHDSPNGGLRAIRDRNAQITAQRQPQDQETST